MYSLGKRDEIEGKSVQKLEPLQIYGEPTKMPDVGEDHSVICGLDRGIYELLFICQSLGDMKQLYGEYAAGMALQIYWYKGTLTSIKLISLGPDTGLAGSVINDYAQEAPLEVKQAVAGYAMGNPGAAKVLAKRAASFKTAKEVEDLVGWPLSEHNLQRTAQIWDRFRD